MNQDRILTACLAALLVAGGAARAAESKPDPQLTVLPLYTLPDSAAVGRA